MKTTVVRTCLLINKNMSLFINSVWDQGQIGIKLGTKHVIYQQVTSVT